MAKQSNRQLPLFALLMALVVVVLWSLILFNIVPRTELFIIVASVTSLLTLILFEAGERVQQTAQRVNEAEVGAEKLAQILTANLGETWMLHHNVRLPDVPPVRHLLVSEQGVFALNVINSMATHHVEGDTWRKRQQQTWDDLGYSPSKEVRNCAAGVATWFATAGTNVDVQPRIAWMGNGTILEDDPAVPIWKIDEQALMIEEIKRGEMTADHAQVNALIKPYAN